MAAPGGTVSSSRARFSVTMLRLPFTSPEVRGEQDTDTARRVIEPQYKPSSLSDQA